MGMEGTLKSSVMITIFVIAIVTFAVQFAIDNDSDISLGNDNRFTSLNSTLRANVTNMKADADVSQEVLMKTSLASGDAEISGSGGQFKIGPFGAMAMTVSSLTAGFNLIFGSEFNFILVMFVALFTFLIGYYVIKAWLGRDPSD